MASITLIEFQDSVNLSFNDHSLLLRALTHPSYLNEHPKDGLEDNQRLEFLGDAVLDFISGELLYHRFPEAPEGRLTRLRAALVRTETLANFARDCHIDSALMLGRGEEDSGGRTRDNNLCAAFEAVVGGLYLDKDVDAVRQFVNPLFISALDNVVRLDLDKDAKSRLQEWCQAHMNVTPAYQTIDERGPDHAKMFTVIVTIAGKRYAEGNGRSKQAAAQQAARKALAMLADSNKL